MERRAGLTALVVTALVACAALTGCSPRPPSPPDTAEAHEDFGIPAKPDGTFELQKDVVVVGDGKNSVWAIEDDGFTMVLDSSAKGVADLREGSVLLATGKATGRVARIDRRGARTEVVILPVQLNELIRNGEVKTDTEYSPADLEWIDVPRATPVQVTSTRRGQAPTIELASAVVRAGGFSGTTGNLTFGAESDAKGYTFAVAIKSGEKLKVGLDFKVKAGKVRAKTSTTIKDGVMVGSAGSFTGVEGIGLDMYAGSSQQGGTTSQFKLQYPITVPPLTEPIGGIPVTAKIKPSITASFALVGTNATVKGRGFYTFSTDVSYNQDGVSVPLGLPDFHVGESLLSSLSGIAIGGATITGGLDLKFIVGVGVPGLLGGPYGRITFVLGGGIGSAIGSPLVLCQKGTLDIKAGGGAGIDFDAPKKLQDLLKGSAIAKRLKLGSSNEFRVFDSSKELVHLEGTIPDKPFCKS